MRLILLLSLLAAPAFALKTAYVSFDHPEGWRCELSQGVWICQANADPDRKESVILSIATMATEWDSIENYEEYLKQPRTVQDEDGNTLTSEVRYVRKRNIGGQVWVDSLQYNSELPGFWARYVCTVHATAKSKLAILITYIVSDEKYKQFAPQFERMISSLQPNAEFDLNIATRQGDMPLPGSEKLGPIQRSIIADRLRKGSKDTAPKAEAPKKQDPTVLLIGAGAIAVIGVILLRIRRKKKDAGANANPSARRRRL